MTNNSSSLPAHLVAEADQLDAAQRDDDGVTDRLVERALEAERREGAGPASATWPF